MGILANKKIKSKMSRLVDRAGIKLYKWDVSIKSRWMSNLINKMVEIMANYVISTCWTFQAILNRTRSGFVFYIICVTSLTSVIMS